jgi:molybdopterin converting factor small subunit
MKVEVRLYATLRRYGSPEQAPLRLDVPEGSRVARVLEILSIPSGEERVILLNGRPADDGSALHEGDRLVLFPPVAGG